MASVVALAAAVVAYGLATLQLSRAATDGGVLKHPRWWLGVALQGVGFLLTFFARHQLPLILVQPVLTTSLVVTTVAGAAWGMWRLGRADLLRCLLVVAGVALLAAAARPGPAGPLGLPGATALTIAELIAVGGLLRPPHRLAARHRALWLGGCAGLAYGSVAVAARALAADPVHIVRTGWGAWAVLLMVAGSLAGEAALTVSLRTGHVGGPVSAMYIVSTVAPSAAGLLWLGDRMASDGFPLAAVGTVAALVGSLGLAGHGHPPPATTSTTPTTSTPEV
jgi:drug/metabolite transporter (DMT)-like permease